MDPADEIGMKICSTCQNLIVSYYLFKLKTQKAQEGFRPSDKTLEKENTATEELEEPLVLHTLDIVKNFIDKYSVQSILEDENEQRLIIERHSSSCDSVKQESTKVSLPGANIEELQEITSPLVEQEFTDEEEISEDYNDDDCIVQDDDDGSTTKDIETYECLGTPDPLFDSIEAVDPTNTERFVLDDIEFVERTPEYLVKAYKPSEKKSRPKDPDNWIRNKLRNARIRGEKYTTKSGRSIPAKRLQSPCHANCRLKCQSKISQEDRQKNFDQYWELASFILQRKFIFEHHKAVPVQRRRFRSVEGKPRQYSSHYFLDSFNSNGSLEQVQVCERMFLRTFDICRNIVSYLHKKVQTGKVQDLRGINRRKLSQGHEAAIEQIKANPFYHIEQPMPIAKMFKLYQQDCTDKGIEPVKNHTYRKLFVEYNECDFLKRDKIICEVCDRYYSSSEEEKRTLSDDYKQHILLQEKCMQRAKARTRQARKVECCHLTKTLLEKQEPCTVDDDDMIVEEHLSYDNEEIDYT